MCRVVVLLLVVGCSFHPPSGMLDDAPRDGDAGSEGDPSCTPWGTRGGHVPDVCATPQGGVWKVDGAGATYNTNDGSYSEGTAPLSYLVPQIPGLSLRVISVAELAIEQGASLRIVGEHPALVLSWSTITVAGMLDVSSQRAIPESGAGANYTSSCTGATDGEDTEDGGGGGGGGWGQGGGNGGDGGLSGDGNDGGTGGGSIGRPEGIVRGGCRGGDSGSNPTSGGDSGGAIQLTAQTSITIASTGVIHAGGEGGAGSSGSGGGGGGGSGGFIGLDAPMVITETGSVLAANGGAGGAGCDDGAGAPGTDALPANMVAAGGPGTSCTNGADGGRGRARTQPPPPPISVNGADSDDGGGGGGGGGVGYIVVWTPQGKFARAGTQTPQENHVTAIEMR